MSLATDSLLAELQEPPARIAFRDWLPKQPANVQTALHDVALDPAWSTHRIEKVVRKYGASCSKESIDLWRAELGYVAA